MQLKKISGILPESVVYETWNDVWKSAIDVVIKNLIKLVFNRKFEFKKIITCTEHSPIFYYVWILNSKLSINEFDFNHYVNSPHYYTQAHDVNFVQVLNPL